MKTQSPTYSPSSDGQRSSNNGPNVVPVTQTSNAPTGVSSPVSPVPKGVTGESILPENQGEMLSKPVVEEKKEEKKKSLNKGDYKPGEVVEVKLLHGVPVKHEGELYYVAVAETKSGNIKGYLVKATAVENTNQPQLILVSDAVELYDWSAELDIVFDDLEKIKRNALLSFWKAGALFETHKADEKIRATMFDSAYPYRMP